ncbi:hypothetical protein [Solitalea koreensis]|uniref:Uncharacterized protein n=1 Tax=Solitalea koreensis TaxID=543615 RepID=A0A521BZN8_9SPHI|nr:hypothetical protein [Solitalea koreensis]SMO52669.1 hypothetical protein SAMN06265350_10380 [Solitalea koreensis]
MTASCMVVGAEIHKNLKYIKQGASKPVRAVQQKEDEILLVIIKQIN